MIQIDDCYVFPFVHTEKMGKEIFNAIRGATSQAWLEKKNNITKMLQYVALEKKFRIIIFTVLTR